jgi:4-oxalomesaconate tautomerase
LTSKVAIVSSSADADADIDYLFLQVVVDEPVVSSSQTCGNMLAAVAPFAIDRGLVPAADGTTSVRVRLVNTDAIAVLEVQTPDEAVTYEGAAAITGVPGTAAPVVVTSEPLDRPLLPTGTVLDELAGHEVTCIDNGMPSVLVRAEDLGVDGDESPAELESRAALVRAVAEIRAAAAARMGLLDASRRDGETDEQVLARLSTPKVVLLSAPRAGGAIGTRSFIPTRVHEAIGVLGAASVAAALVLPGSVAADLCSVPSPDEPLRIEHPSGHLDIRLERTDDPAHPVGATSVVRTARLLLDGVAFPGPPRAAVVNRSAEDPS